MNLNKIIIKNIALYDKKKQDIYSTGKIYGKGFLMYAFVNDNSKTTFSTENKIINITETASTKGYSFTIAPSINQIVNIYHSSYDDITLPTINVNSVDSYFKKINLRESINLNMSTSGCFFYYGADVLTFEEYLQIDVSFYAENTRKCSFVIVYEPTE